MLAAILVEQNKPLVIDQITLASKLDVGQVLVKIHYSGICGSQIGEIQGVKGPDKYLPHLLGHEAVGTVEEIGPGVREVQKSDLVVLHWRKGKGIDAVPAKYTWKGKTLNAGQVTTFSEYSVVSENRVTKLTEDIDLKGASLLGCAVTTGFGVITNNARLKIGESLAVIGCGGVGLNVIEGGSLAGAYPIIGIDRVEGRLQFSKKFGATYTINTEKSNWQEMVREVDVVVDTTGISSLIEAGYKFAKSKLILVGVPKEKISIYSLPLHFDKKIIGSHGGESDPSVDIPRLARLAKAGKINLSELITHEVALNDIQSAINKMISGEIIGRSIVKCS